MTSDDLCRQLRTQLPPDGRLWVGFSGGLDSAVLLHALCRSGFAGRVHALHVHHGLSANADQWQDHCRQVCEELGVPLVCERVVLNDRGDGLEQAARQARYQVFGRYTRPGDTLLLAHHSDDQIETFFQRLLRGSGLTGLAAMAAARPLKPGVTLMRPLLNVSRAQLAQWAQAWQIRWVNDESNLNDDYDRNWWRNRLLPVLFSRFPGQKPALLRSLRQLQQDNEVLTLLLAPYRERCLQPVDWPGVHALALDVDALGECEPRLRPYMVRAWLQSAGLMQPSAQWLEVLNNEVMAAAPDRQPQLVVGPWQVRRHRQWLCLCQSVAAPQPQAWDGSSGMSWGAGHLSASGAESGLVAGKYRVVPASMVRGQTLTLPGRPAKGLKALFQEAGIPAWLRDDWPAVVTAEPEAQAVEGVANWVALAGIGVAASHSQRGGALPLWTR